MPPGRQQNSVTRIAHTRWFGIGARGAPAAGAVAWGGGVLGPADIGGTGGVTESAAPHCSQTLAPAVFWWPQLVQIMVFPWKVVVVHARAPRRGN
ncbi:hypothetical protein GCM10027193_18240 [Arenimonas aestuarii]